MRPRVPEPARAALPISWVRLFHSDLHAVQQGDKFVEARGIVAVTKGLIAFGEVGDCSGEGGGWERGGEFAGWGIEEAGTGESEKTSGDQA